jgi:hypothetical protein
MKTKDLSHLSRSKSLKTTHHQKWGGVGGKGFGFDFSGNGKPETGNSCLFIYPKLRDI